ncbi:ABC transporter permease [Oceanobacillus damuensis]|uniref:ABC transporter permease n=1 Tax=Oceanobacillus damuensis TaxID=937928 RepID=UPI000ABC88AB|nr:ABC transporter permease [Oceanobacillus damuensis]
MKWVKMLLVSKVGLIGVIIIILFTFTAIFAPLIVPHDPTEVNLGKSSLPPIWLDGGESTYLLGTDNLGRDVFSRIIYGSQISMLVGVCSVLVAGLIGIPVGLISGYYGGLVDSLLMRIVDSQIAIPSILLALVILGFMNPTLLTIIFVIGVSSWIAYARVVRSEVLSLKEREYVKAAKTMGVRHSFIMTRHLLPNVFSSIIVISTINVATSIITESSLSFLGLGPQSISWGSILSEGRDYLATNWWVATFPGIAITVTVLGIILFGDWLRDVLDPRTEV